MKPIEPFQEQGNAPNLQIASMISNNPLDNRPKIFIFTLAHQIKYICFRLLLFLIAIKSYGINPLKSVTLKQKRYPHPLHHFLYASLHYLLGLTTENSTETDLLAISNISQCKSRDLVQNHSSYHYHTFIKVSPSADDAVMRNYSKYIVVLKIDLDPSSLSSLV